MTVRLGGIDHSLDSDALEDGDPFGDFAACSGLRDLIGNYTVAIGSEDGDIEWVSVTSTSRIESSGIVDADIRVETASDRIDASGTLTLESSLQAGTFVGFDDAGDRVVGSFRCDGASSPDLIGPDTEPLLEVVVLLRRGTSQRVVTLAGDDPAVIACADGDMIARADGDRSIGAITRFELSTTGALLLTVGAIDYDAERADVHQNADGDSGSFDAAVGDVTIDGAYSCT